MRNIDASQRPTTESVLILYVLVRQNSNACCVDAHWIADSPFVNAVVAALHLLGECF